MRPTHGSAPAILFAALCVVSVPTEGADAWNVKPDPITDPVKIPTKWTTSIPVSLGSRVIYPNTASPFVAIGQNRDDDDVRELWDLRDQTKKGTIRGKAGSLIKEVFRLSPDGKRLAGRAGESSMQTPNIEIWSFETGERVRRIEPSPAPKELDVFEFAGPNRLALVNETDKLKKIQVVDLDTGKTLWSHTAPDGFVPATLAVSPAAKYIAYLGKKRLYVLHADTGRPAGQLDTTEALGAALSFSPDGKEIAGLYFESPGGRLMAWDIEKGTVSVDYHLAAGPTFPVGGQFVGGPKIDWLPDGSAWLLADHAIVDRDNGRWVWTLIQAKNDIGGLSPKILDADHALALVGRPMAAKRLEVITLPWPQIDASLKAAQSESPAILRPGDSIGLKFYIEKLRGSSAQEVQAELAKALTASLEAQGMRVADGQTVVLHVRYNEEETGSPLYARKLGERFDFRNPTGPAYHATKFKAELALTSGNPNKPIWTEELAASYAPFGLVQGEVSDKSIRDGGFATFLRSAIPSVTIPFFIPKDTKLSMLPGVTTPTPSPSLRGGKATSRPTTRGRSGSKP
jgi:hypothetical protein